MVSSSVRLTKEQRIRSEMSSRIVVSKGTHTSEKSYDYVGLGMPVSMWLRNNGDTVTKEVRRAAKRSAAALIGMLD